MNSQLTIAIPTYNRPYELIETLLQLVSQKDIDKCKIIVVDNCSEQIVSDVIKAKLGDENNIDVVRNVANLGLSGNILRCMECASSEWLWILADDDNVESDSVSSILQRIQYEPSADFVLYGLLPGQSKSTAVQGINNFADTLDDWGRITFISAGVYRTSSAKKLLSVGINYAYSVVPFIAIIIHGIEEHGWRVGFDDRVLVKPAHKASATWSWVWSINTYLVLELIENKYARSKLSRLASLWCLGPIGLAHDLATRRMTNRGGLSNLSYGHKRFLIAWGGTNQKLLLQLTCLISHVSPRITLLLISVIRTLTNRQYRSARSGESVFGQV